MRYLIAFLLLLAGIAHAQPCLPADNPTRSDNPQAWVQPAQNVGWWGTPLHVGVTKNGAWSRYWCVEAATGRLVTVSRVSLPADWGNVGGRLRTVMGAADPLKSLQTAPSRMTVLPLTDPSLAAIVADMEAGAGEL